MDDSAHKARLANASTSLAEWLSPIGFSSATASQVTARLTAEVERWAEHYGFACATEGSVQYYREGLFGPRWTNGYIDVVGIRPTGLSLAVEIDRTDKVRSLAKLASRAADGTVAIWLRWCHATSMLMPPGVAAVDFRVDRYYTNTGPRFRRQPHLTWPAPPARLKPPPRLTYQPPLFDIPPTVDQPQRKRPGETDPPARPGRYPAA
ncbi:hypothetical protein ACFPIJ_18695 [Dactylosporangium cerinum]|uniref:Uncharacterized protein n=1 Tax=Dactylosporangium cerinum TaxID=1434730 RepID=A0ABV9VWF7_9ACTN